MANKKQPKEEKQQKSMKCLKCGKQQSIKKYKSIYKWCDPCRAKIETVEVLERFLKESKISFNSNLWNRCTEIITEKYPDVSPEEIEKKTIKDYFRQSNLPQNKNSERNGEPQKIEDLIDVDTLRFWGKFEDYTVEDYEFLSDNYEYWINECKSDTLAEKKLYKQICLQELEIQKLREQRKDVTKQVDTLQKLMDAANVKPKDINAANDPSNANILGMIIRDIEKYRPAEYFEDKKLYVDFDGIKDYLDRFIFRPLKNLLLGSREFDKEFNIEEISDKNG